MQFLCTCGCSYGKVPQPKDVLPTQPAYLWSKVLLGVQYTWPGEETQGCHCVSIDLSTRYVFYFFDVEKQSKVSDTSKDGVG